MNRRAALQSAGAALLALQAAGQTTSAETASAKNGRLKQSVCRWCYKNISMDDLCRASADMGLRGVDLVAPEDWPTVKKYGLTPSMVYSAGTIPDGWNRLENHERLVQEMQENIPKAAAAGCPNVITFSGNRRGLPDDQGIENCITGLRRVSKIAEDHGTTICMELLNSKVNHHDYQCDHTAWGVAVMKGVGSPRVKLLYDIYHMQIMEGDIIRTVTENIQYIGHFHTGGVPGRHELDQTQELQWPTVARAIADLNFQGYFAHEFVPTQDPLTSLRQAAQSCTV